MASAPTAPHRFSGPGAAWIAAGAAAVLMMLTPALWNGFPLLFPDTGGYLARPFEDTLEMGRSALYGMFLAAGIPFEFWANVVVQSALAVWLIGIVLRVHGLATPASLLGTVGSLCLVTGLPWYATTLMPDILLPAAVLALYLLAFHANACGAIERGGLVATVAVAIASHMGTLAVALGLVVVIALLAVLRVPALRLPRPQRPLLAAAAVVAGIALAPLSNLAVVGKFAFTPGGDSFLFGRLVQDGIVARYLEDRCPDPGIALCRYRNR